MSKETTPAAAKASSPDSFDYETCIVEKQLIRIPRFLAEDESLFFSLMSIDTWNLLAVETKAELKTLLPEESNLDKNDIVNQLLTGKNFFFGNPVRKFFRQLHAGSFHPDLASFSSLCRRAKYKDYLLRQKDHFSQLVVDILPSRQVVLDVVSLLPEEESPLRIKPPLSTHNHPRRRPVLGALSSTSKPRRVFARASLEYYRALAEVRQDVADDGETSSEDEPFPDEAPLGLKAKGFSSSDPAALDAVASPWKDGDDDDDDDVDGRRGHRRRRRLNGEGNDFDDVDDNVDYDDDDGAADDNRTPSSTRRLRVMDTFAPETDPVSNEEFRSGGGGHDAKACSLSPPITNDRYKQMVRRHKKRRKCASSSHHVFRPDLQTDGIDLKDLILRTEISISTLNHDEVDENLIVTI